ncbi:MAG: hypothetical protein ACI8RZ_001377 [Myxococcota bacterium]|jgi:hypothetical protein
MIRRLLLCLLLMLLGGAVDAADHRPLNDAILRLIGSYPLDGRYPYGWVRGVDTDGVSQPLTWQGTTLGLPDAAQSVHCSGITFEVYIQALSQAIPEGGPTGAEVLALKESWYIREEGSVVDSTAEVQTGPVQALVSRGLGLEVAELADLQPGDFIQFWRNNGNGHSAVFIDHTRYRDGTVRGLVFWSAQGSSEGLGYRRVSIGSGEFQISPGNLFGVRALVP